MKQQTTNNKQNRIPAKILFLLVFPFVLCCMFYVVRSTRAQTSSQTFTAIPPRLEVQVKPGEFVKKVIQFRNEGDEIAYLTLIPKDFIVKGTEGKPEFVTSQVSGRWSAASWIKVSPSSIAVLPKTTTNITLSVNTPLDALPGGHYAGVLYQSSGTPLRLGTGIGAGTAIKQVVGTLVYLTVAGPVTENALVKQFSVPKFLEYGPVPFATEIINQSDLHITPKGQITVRDMFGKTQGVLSLEERNIFPGASLIYQNNWDKKVLVGRYRADLSAVYGNQGRVLAATVYFWVLPWKVVSVTLLAILILVLIIILTTRQIRRRQEELEEKLMEEEEEIEELKKQITTDHHR